jgi:hypothetical protein
VLVQNKEDDINISSNVACSHHAKS